MGMSPDMYRAIKRLLERPSLLARKIAFCPSYEFQKTDLLPKAVLHDLGMKNIEDKLEEMGFRKESVKLKYGIPDGILSKDGKIYIHEHKISKLDKVAFLQALLYSKEYEKEYGELPGIVLTNNSEDIKIYESEEIRDCVRYLDKISKKVIRDAFVGKVTPGRHCSHCGNTRCPYYSKYN